MNESNTYRYTSSKHLKEVNFRKLRNLQHWLKLENLNRLFSVVSYLLLDTALVFSHCNMIFP